jgi:hypothetical protein
VLILSVSGVWVSPGFSFLDRHGDVQYHVRLILLYSRDTVRYSGGIRYYTALHYAVYIPPWYMYPTFVHLQSNTPTEITILPYTDRRTKANAKQAE